MKYFNLLGKICLALALCSSCNLRAPCPGSAYCHACIAARGAPAAQRSSPVEHHVDSDDWNYQPFASVYPSSAGSDDLKAAARPVKDRFTTEAGSIMTARSVSAASKPFNARSRSAP